MAQLYGNVPFLEAAYRQRPKQEDLSHSFISAYQFAQQQKLEERKVASQETANALHNEATRMQIQNFGLDFIAKKRMADATLKVKQGYALLSEKMATIDWSDAKDRASIWEIGKQYPELIETPEWNRIQQNFINSDKAATQAERYQNMYEISQGRLGLEKERNQNLADIAEAKNQLAAARNETDKQHWQNMADVAEAKNKLLETRLDAGTPAQQDMNAAAALRKEAEALRASGDAQGYQDKIRQAELLETHIAPKGVVSQIGYDDQGRPIMTTTVGGTPTVGTQTIAQGKQISFEVASEGITDILGKLRPTDVGVAGVAGEQVFDRWLGQVDPKMVSGQRVSNRRALGALTETLFQALSPERIGGSGFSNKDADRLKAIAGTVEAAHSYPEIVSGLNEIRSIIKDRSRVFAERTGQPIPDFAKEPAEIQKDYVNRLNALQKAVDNFTMTREQADAEAKALAQKTADSLQRFHGIQATFK